MTTKRSIHCEYPVAPDAVMALLQDEQALARRCAAANESNVDIRVVRGEQSVRVTVARDRAVELPAFARKLFQPVNRVTDDVSWRREGEHWLADYTIEVQGIPAEVRGKSRLSPAPGGAHYESSFEVTSNVPLLASKIERFLADRLEESLRTIASRNAETLRPPA